MARNLIRTRIWRSVMSSSLFCFFFVPSNSTLFERSSRSQQCKRWAYPASVYIEHRWFIYTLEPHPPWTNIRLVFVSDWCWRFSVILRLCFVCSTARRICQGSRIWSLLRQIETQCTCRAQQQTEGRGESSRREGVGGSRGVGPLQLSDASLCWLRLDQAVCGASPRAHTHHQTGLQFHQRAPESNMAAHLAQWSCPIAYSKNIVLWLTHYRGH